MTESSYVKLLQYIDSAEKSKLFTFLQKKRFSVNGFKNLASAPPVLVARALAHGEERLFRSLTQEYSEEYDSEESAKSDFSPERVFHCLAFFWNKNLLTDELVEELIGDQHNTSQRIQIESVHTSDKRFEKLEQQVEKAVKKYEEQKKKTLKCREEISLLKKENETITSKNVQLNDSCNTLQMQIIELKTERASLEQTVSKLKAKVKALEEEAAKKNDEISKLQATLTKRKQHIIVVSPKQLNIKISGVKNVTYDQISELQNKATLRLVSEVLYSKSEVEFSIIRKLEKNELIYGRLHPFDTTTDMIEYLTRED